MAALENRIPPPILCAVLAIAMGAAAWAAPPTHVPATARFVLAGGCALIGLACGAPAFRAFGRARTTINPVDIDAASTLVTDGIYRYTRNPMYLGLLALLAAWAVYLGVGWALLGPMIFVAFITRFQIMPEERVLQGKFGAAYADYRARVRRWV
jgi:protein-S-isoprenylcysteine O-methyltransferase Ste14